VAKTLKDVAEAAGVSSATASLVLNGRADGRVSTDLAGRVEEAAARLNYRPNLVARSLRTQESKTIGIISNDVATTPFAGAMLSGAQEVAWRNGWLLLLVNSNGDAAMEKAAARSLIQRNVDGFIYAAMFHQEIKTPEYLTGQKVILLDCVDSAKEYESVVPNEYQGATEAVQYLVDQGHTRIAHIGTKENTIAGRERLKAFKDVLMTNELEFISDYVVEVASANSIDGYAGTQKLLALKNRPTAIFCYTDRMAMGAYEAIAEAGLSIPKDISVVGFDNQLNIADALRPPLTTVQLPHFEMGAWAATRLLEAIDPENSEPLTQHGQVITCPLVIRDSVAPPRK
jgi:LacI family transcriptional regulator